MDIDQARAFVRQHHSAVLATMRRDGRPQMSAVAVGLDDDGVPVISTREGAAKVRNIRRDPRVSVFVTASDFRNWIQIDGTATPISLPDAMETLVTYYRSVSGEHPDWDDYRRAMVDEQRLILRIDVERAGPG